MTPTAHLAPEVLAGARDLMDAAFDDFTDHDWSHALGGLHAVVVHDGRVVAHASLVQRRLLVGGASGRSLRCGYVEAVAVDPAHQGTGLGARVMTEVEDLAPGHDLLALSASERAAGFYAARGWRLWRGPSSVMAPGGLEPTPDDDGAIFVLDGPSGPGLDLDAPIACDWRDGDVW
ncbi:aminoglycoside N-acetyltransferase AAC(2')-Id [Nocardioides marinquilinus]|uniref:Aminoglycoside N-acetyltransferase AAC(2')-Id n=1 Tax=Nocardioides marinquilinus TaxID=1210400 RepID=A0ABP9PR15_9ACTN